MAALDPETLNRWRGLVVVDAEGATIGPIAELYHDPGGALAWAVLRTGLFGDRLAMVPLTEAVERDREIHLPYPKAMVRQAPRIDPPGAGGGLSADQRALLAQHYRLTPDVAALRPDAAMTRSEEELRTGTRVRTRRFRLRREVVVEEVTCTVSLRREVVRLEEVPQGEPVAGGEVDHGFELVLRREQPVIGTRVVPYERVRVVKRTVREAHQVTAELRKERIELDTTAGVSEAAAEAPAAPPEG